MGAVVAAGLSLATGPTGCKKDPEEPVHMALCREFEAAGVAKGCRDETTELVTIHGMDGVAAFVDPGDPTREGAILRYDNSASFRHSSMRAELHPPQGKATYLNSRTQVMVELDASYSAPNAQRIAELMAGSLVHTRAEPPPPPAPAEPPPKDIFAAFQERLDSSTELCRRMAADPEWYRGKPWTLVVQVSPDDYYNYKYAEAQQTHYAFRVDCGETYFYAYALKKRFRPLFEYLLTDANRPVEIAVVTDESHADTRTSTVTDWQLLTHETSVAITPPTTPVEESAALCRRMTLDIGSFYGKPQTIRAKIRKDDYFNFKYLHARDTHYSFAIECGEVELHSYGERQRLGDLHAHLCDHGSAVLDLTVLTDRSHGNHRTFTLQGWKQPYSLPRSEEP